ncbi:glucose-6-phosphate dehydrogenase [Amycolatopsis sp. SID8362]|uniref:glucose-6-phosphate dehydrogenase n=1 Tax=Amycolatopsis sp. SID8362 TaxID=2690346 RepID=UPI0013696CDC|nr:glucose-6-phosphate dehydrogenase [Amycolatopsis sp. SID8362]NBH03247.1 glucose-6-phosphate dehydrogenase [Amycolatopsis sp. SID8362]NED39948.1 glucose-6-phosphate dehydrogenase [Amycolatopsis sp. SID8362]
MSERLSDFFEDALRRHFGTGAGSPPGIRRADVDKLLSDDGPRRVALGRLAALDWGGREAAGGVTITSERLLVTHHGLVYLAGLTAQNPGPLRELLYLSTPPSLLDPIVDRIDTSRIPPGAAAAVDRRLGRELHFVWPLDTSLRRLLDAAPILLMESSTQR